MSNSPNISQEAVAPALKPYLDKGLNIYHYKDDMACVSLADQGQKKKRWQRKHHIQRDIKISWIDTHDMVTADQAMCLLQVPLSSVLMVVFVIFHANSTTA